MEEADSSVHVEVDGTETTMLDEQDKKEDRKKKHTWGLVAGTRQSVRIQGNAGKTIMALAHENKKRKNLEGPLQFSYSKV
jgi:hypothetical protein